MIFTFLKQYTMTYSDGSWEKTVVAKESYAIYIQTTEFWKKSKGI
jgi:hypothetical protein